MHPGAGNYDNTIVNALINYDKKLSSNIGDELRPGIVHRIDKNTSGLVVVAKIILLMKIYLLNLVIILLSDLTNFSFGEIKTI